MITDKCAMCDGPVHGAKEPHVFNKANAASEPVTVTTKRLPVKTKPVKTKGASVKTKGMTNTERQRKWQRDHRDEFNKRRREFYQKGKAKR